jgi:hypothetical protein
VELFERNPKMDLEKRLRRLEMQNRLLASKLYQVCLSHDHLSIALQRANVPMSNTDKCMMEATSRIVKAKTPEEIETIYSESSSKIFKGVVPDAPKSPVNKVWFFKENKASKDLIEQIEQMIADIDAQIQGMSKADQELYQEGLDDQDLPEPPEDENDLKPPF